VEATDAKDAVKCSEKQTMRNRPMRERLIRGRPGAHTAKFAPIHVLKTDLVQTRRSSSTTR
jgi:hypothetical protein